MSILVIDVGTSSVRAAVVRPDGTLDAVHQRATPPDTPFPGLVEFDAAALAAAALDVARASLAEGGPVDAVGVANQRASTIVWDRETGEPVAPALGWQDLRTVGTCLELQAEGFRLAPNASATKLAAILDQADPERDRDLCFGTVDSWIVWHLTGGHDHVTDLSNAAVTGLVNISGGSWSERVLERLVIPPDCLPDVVDSSGVLGFATALDGTPPIAGIAGDQQASLIGQSCVRPGMAKATFGTGGMLDVCLGERPAFETRGEGGCFPIVCWRRGDEVVWGAEAIMLAAGSNVDWLVEDLGILGSAAESHDVASQCDDTGGVVYVPAVSGLGTPYWDHGARGTLLGLTRGSGRPEIVRAVLEGIAQRGADLLEAAETDGGASIEALRVDGGMSANPTFVQALADATQHTVEVSPVTEATTLGAAYLAGLAVGTWAGWDDIAAAWKPSRVVEPARTLDRAKWADAIGRAKAWIPELSALDF
ncbi:MAG: glycerol kinase [Actinomycetia bacterium]|nr:glycerol kinase [Actinomycetes bacterium]